MVEKEVDQNGENSEANGQAEQPSEEVGAVLCKPITVDADMGQVSKMDDESADLDEREAKRQRLKQDVSVQGNGEMDDAQAMEETKKRLDIENRMDELISNAVQAREANART